MKKYAAVLTGSSTGVTINAGPHKNCLYISQVAVSLKNLEKIFLIKSVAQSSYSNHILMLKETHDYSIILYYKTLNLIHNMMKWYNTY